MTFYRRFMNFGILISALVGLSVINIAQEVPGPGEGGPIIAANLGSDIATLNPLLSSDGSSNTVIARLFPSLIGIDIETLNLAPDQNGAIAESWTISDDGLVYTFKLRQDLLWSDGTPITANDYKYSFDAIASGETNTALTYVLDDIEAVEVVDDFTLNITIKNAKCSALGNISFVPVVPSHIYSAQFPTFADMNESPLNLEAPGATWGPYTFGNFRPGEQVTLLADKTYTDTQAGYVIPEGFVFKNVASETLIMEQFLAGELTVANPPDDRKQEMRDLGANGEALVWEEPASTVQFIAFNSADPANPQPGLDEAGNAIDQGNHPILGDVRVRQASCTP